MPKIWGLALWWLYEHILIDITSLSDIFNSRTKLSIRIYFDLFIFDQHISLLDVTWNIATSLNPNVSGN